jgi:hypothetical protein
VSKLLRCAADLAVAAFLAVALLVVYQWDNRTEQTRSRPAADTDLTVTTEEQTQVEELPPEPLKLAVTPASFDDMGKLLDTLGAGFKYDVVEESKLEDPAVCQQYDVIFLTCAEAKTADSQEKLQASLRPFVNQGGTLYASDLRYDLLAAAFPEFVDATAVAQGTKQDLQAEVLEPGLQAILGNELPLHFDLEGWRPAAFGGREVTVYLKGKFRTTAGVSIESPLLVKFPVGSGTVVFTSFHNEKQNNDAEVQMLKYLVFTIVTAQVESKVTKTMVSGGFSPQQQNLLSATADHPSVTSKYEHQQAGDLQFALGFERQGAKLRLEVKSPDGKSFVQEGDATFTISVPAAGSGTWQYTVVAEKLPYPNFPFTLTVGAVSTAVVAGAKPESPLTPSGELPATSPSRKLASGKVTFKEIELKPAEPAKKWRIGVTPPAYDNMGKLLDTLGEGYRYENLPMAALLDPARLAGFDVIFLTCASEGAGAEPLHQNLRRYVQGGGTLYASDLRYPMIAATFPGFVGTDAGSSKATRQKQLDEARQQLEQLLAPDMEVEPLADALGRAGLGPALAGKIDQIVTALQKANLADKPRPAKTAIGRALSDAGLTPVPETDIAALAKAVHDRALKINRSKHEAKKEAQESAQVLTLRQRIQQLEAQLAAGVEVAGLQTGRVQNLKADVVEPGLQEVLGRTMDLKFDAGDWIPAYFAGKDVTVYLRGTYTTSSGTNAEAPLLVKFPVGQGTVIFTAFHNEAQNSEQEEKLLRYLVFTAVTAKEESLVAKTMTSGGFSPAKRSLISHRAGDPSVTQVYRNDHPGRLQFALTFANQGARLRFTLVAPTGQKFEKDVESTLVVEVPDAPAGAWQYTVTALQVPYENFPFSVNVGEEKADP